MEVEELAVGYSNSGNNPNKDPNTVRDPDRIRTNAEAVEEENEPEKVEPEGKHGDRKAEGQKSNNTHSEGHYGNLA